MREHGVLNRILLIYEEIMRRLDVNDFQFSSLTKSLYIIRVFIEQYHEELEEHYIFPLFKNDKKLFKLTETLRDQHNKGRAITAQLLEITSSGKKPDKKMKLKIHSLLKKFIRMYRPHEAREDTVLFPTVRSLTSEKEFNELGEKFEAMEHKLFGEQGFQLIVQKVEEIEKELGIYAIEQFTPNISSRKFTD